MGILWYGRSLSVDDIYSMSESDCELFLKNNLTKKRQNRKVIKEKWFSIVDYNSVNKTIA